LIGETNTNTFVPDTKLFPLPWGRGKDGEGESRKIEQIEAVRMDYSN
jgi:hypothetical protein